MKNLRTRMTEIWSALTCHRLPRRADLSAGQSSLQRLAKTTGRPPAFDGDKSPAKSGENSPHSRSPGWRLRLAAEFHRLPISSLFRFGLVAAIGLVVGCRSAEKSSELSTAPAVGIQSNVWGHVPDGAEVQLFTLTNRHGMVAKISTLGATIVELQVPDRHGALTNVVLGPANFESSRGFPASASTIGRFANRIAGARFMLEGKEIKVTANSGTNHIHGGRRGFASVVWKLHRTEFWPNRAAVVLSYLSPHGEEGFPGNLRATVTFTLTAGNELLIDYAATTDATTVVNLTNHGYFNLAGYGDVHDHLLWLAAHRYTLTDGQLIPTGKIAPVAGTPLDFTQPTAISARIDQLKPALNGYDHNFVLDREGRSLSLAARVTDPKSGRVMEVLTTEPGMQIYTGNHLNGKVAGVGGVVYPRHGGVCFETQHFPDSPNKSQFPSTALRPGETFRSTTAFRFTNSGK